MVGISGATGIQGATGVIGATGIQGPTGATGAQGSTGAMGVTGATGVIGVSGATGVGATGLTGATGATGVVGVSGATGVVGATGVGATGATGATGVIGVSGATGVGITGATGATGVAGISAAGRIWYFADLLSDISGYETLQPDTPDADPQEDLTAVVINTGGQVLIIDSATAAGDPGLTEIPPGEYEFRFWGYVSDIAGSTNLVFKVYKRNTGGTETLLFEVDGPEMNATSSNFYTALTIAVSPIAIDETDRIVVKVYAETTNTSNVTAHFLHSGITPSNIRTAITQGFVGPQGATGATGVVGVTGATGIQGATGVQGSTGPTGVIGVTGATGVQGATGVEGLTGATGVVGVSGATGVQGSTGVVGVSGATGATGVIGISGATGVIGITGATGATGVIGISGATGVQGATGVEGPTGATGVVGISGATGATGVQGATGVIGVSGATGATGVSGITGATGVEGPTGATGVIGVSGATGVGATGATGVAGSVTDGDKGDITVSGSGTVWTIDSGVVTSDKIADNTIVNADVNTSAAIAGTKVTPDFGAQNIITTGLITGHLTPKAGTATAGTSPLKFLTGTNLTTAEAGAVEYDGTYYYFTSDTTSGRAHNGTFQTFRLTANGSAIGPAITDYFGATSAINLAATSVYEIEWFAYLQKSTAGTLTWTHTASSAPTLISSLWRAGPVSGIAAGTPTTLYTGSRGATTAAFGASGSINNNAFMAYEFRTRVITNAATNFRLRVTSSAGTVTPQAGSFYTVRRVSDTTGSFAA